MVQRAGSGRIRPASPACRIGRLGVGTQGRAQRIVFLADPLGLCGVCRSREQGAGSREQGATQRVPGREQGAELQIFNFQFSIFNLQSSVVSPRPPLLRPGAVMQADAGDAALRAVIVGLLAARAVGLPAGDARARWASLGQLLAEKVPLLFLSAISCWITIQAQQRAIGTMEQYPLAGRLANALVAYAAYLGQFFRPVDLAALYLYLQRGPLAVAAAAAFLAAMTFAVVTVRRKYPFLLVGWLWYLGMLVPVIGIVQVGTQSMADRYTYLPLIGPTVALALGAGRLVRRRGPPAAVAGAGRRGRLGGAGGRRLAAERPIRATAARSGSARSTVRRTTTSPGPLWALTANNRIRAGSRRQLQTTAPQFRSIPSTPRRTTTWAPR